MLQERRLLGDAASLAPGRRQLPFQGGLFPVDLLTPGVAGRDAVLCLPLLRDPARVLALGAPERLLRGVQPGGERPDLAVLALPLTDLRGEFRHGLGARLRARGRELLAYGGEGALGVGAVRLDAPVRLVGGVLGRAIHLAVRRPRGSGVLGGAADRAGLAVAQPGGELGRDPAQPLLAQGEPVLMGLVGPLPRGALPFLGGVQPRLEGVALAGGREPAPGRVEPPHQLLRARGREVRRLDPLLVAQSVGVP